jgi:hypothetical protein
VPVSNPIDSLAFISPLAAAAYLRQQGWHLDRAGELGDRWKLRLEDQVRNVAIPHPDLDDQDRSLMLSSVLRVLEETEQRPAATILRDLRDGDSDILMFRVAAPDLVDGNMPLQAAPEMLQGALEAISSAGRAEVQRRPYYGGGQLPAQVKTFVDQARVAPSDKGSVILNIRSKVDPELMAQTSLMPEAERPASDVPFERRAVWRLLHGVRAAKTAVHRDLASRASVDAFDDDIEAGLNANLCDALTHLAGDESELKASVTVSVRWSLFVPSDEPRTNIEVGRNELDALNEVADTLRTIRPLEDRSLTGHVRNLDREPGQLDGTVRVVTDLDGRLAVVKLHLAESDYRTAIRAHDANLPLQFFGTLEKAGRIWEVASPERVELAAD